MPPASISRRPFGATGDGETVECVTLENAGLAVTVIAYGAAIQQLWVPDTSGERANVVLGFPTLTGYVGHSGHYFGAVVGRYANRISGGAFELDGTTYELDHNNGRSCLHGGSRGFDTRVWTIAGISAEGEAPAVVFRYTSGHLEMGFPGTMRVEAAYTLGAETLRLDLRAACDRPTVVNLTGHSLWNLAGEASGSVDDHLLTLHAGHYTPVDPALIPTGEIAEVRGTPLDFTGATPIGARIDSEFEQIVTAEGYDHNFVLDQPAPRAQMPAARLEDPASGRTLEIATTEPGLQLYTGNQLDGALVGTGGRPYAGRSGVALETQHFPDSVHHEHFPSTVLRPGTTFTSTTTYRFSTVSGRSDGRSLKVTRQVGQRMPHAA